MDELALESAWENVPCCDEHYLPTIFAYYNLDNETTCSDGFMHAFFPGGLNISISHVFRPYSS